MCDVNLKLLLRHELWKFIKSELYVERTFGQLISVSGGIFVGVFGPVKTHLKLLSIHIDGKLAGSTHAYFTYCE
jgi:hypothetical protein